GTAFAATGGPKTIIHWFAPNRRGTALGIRQTGVPLGGVVASLLLPGIASPAVGAWPLDASPSRQSSWRSSSGLSIAIQKESRSSSALSISRRSTAVADFWPRPVAL